MLDKTNNRILFDRDGCLTEEGLSLFIDNKLSEAEVLQVEEHAKHCELCRDALEGSLLFNNADVFNQKLNELKASKERLIINKATKSHKLLIAISSVAASLVVLLSIYSILKLQRLSDSVFPLTSSPEIAVVSRDTTYKVPPIPKVSMSAVSTESHSPKPSATNKKASVPEPVRPLAIQEEIIFDDLEEEVVVEELEFNGIEYDVELEYIAVEEHAEGFNEVEDIPMATATTEPRMEIEKPQKSKRGLVRKSKSSGFGKKDESYMMAEVTPMFQGSGAEAFDRYLADNLSVVIPDSVFVESIVVSFVIDTAGNINKVKLVSGTSSKELNKYILKFIESSPVWVPGYVAGRPIETELESEIVLDSTNRKDLQ